MRAQGIRGRRFDRHYLDWKRTEGCEIRSAQGRNRGRYQKWCLDRRAVGFAGPVIVTLASGVDKTEVPLGLAIGVIGAGVGAAVAICWTKNAREPKCFTRPLILLLPPACTKLAGPRKV